MHDIAHDAPNVDVFPLGDVKVGIAWIGRLQQNAAPLPVQLLHEQLAVQDRNDDPIVGCVKGAIHHQQIPVVDAHAQHLVGRSSQEKCRRRVADDELVQVELSIDIIIGGRWEASVHR